MPTLARAIAILSLCTVLLATARPAPVAAAGAGAAAATRYIVQLADPPVAGFDGGLAGLDRTRPAVGNTLDVGAAPARAYERYLAGRQAVAEAAVRRLVPGSRALYHYRVAFNGLVFRLSAAQAAAVSELSGVVAVTPEERVVPLMDTSLDQIGAPAAWADSRVGGRADGGRGIRIAIIDSGITAAHPFFADTGFTAPAGFPRATLTVGDMTCAYSPADVARFTNRKVLVARAYVNPEIAAGRSCDALRGEFTPLADGLAGFHGAHVAGTAAGAVVRGGPGASGAGNLTLSGVAPGAYLLAYKFTNAYTPEILKMIDDAVADGAQVINNSWGTAAMNVLDATAHPVAQAFATATRAGVVVVAAAGNSGSNGEATLGGPHQMSPDVITVANVQTGRTFRYVVKAADTELPEALREHPAVYADVGKAFDVIEAQQFSGDLCNPLSALRARGRVALTSTAKECQGGALPGLPIQLPPQLSFLQGLIIAQQVGARAVVLYTPDAQQAQLIATVLPLAQQLLGLEMPITAVITGENGAQLVTYGETHPAMTLRLESTPLRVLDPAASDGANPSSSQGPAPDFAAASVKPDLAAPGTEILSTSTTQDGAPNGYATASGTSMASPHVAGAAAVLRQAWPAWTPAQVKAALLITADPVVRVGADPAPVTVQGAGRLNLARAMDPGVVVTPPTLNLGIRATGTVTFDLTLTDARRDATGAAIWQLRHEPGPGNTAVVPIVPPEVPVTSGAPTPLRVTFQLPAGLAPGDYDGRIALSDGSRTVRVTYFLRVPGERKDVLLVNVRRTATTTGGGGIPGLPGMGGGFQDTPDYSRFWTAALDEAGLSYDLWTVAEGQAAGTPPLTTLQRYDVVMVAAGDSNAPLDRLPGGMTALQMYLLGGGRLLASGGKWVHAPTPAQAASLQTSGAMYFLSRYFAGFELRGDDQAVTASLQPVRLFDLPVALAATASGAAAGNGGLVDVGRPLAALVTSSPGQGQLAPDLGLAAPGVVDRVMPYMRTYLEAAPGAAAMTGVTADATLEVPARAVGVPWRALFAGFPVEAVLPLPNHHDRAALLRSVFDWSMEPEDLTVTVSGPGQARMGRDVTFTASASSPSGVRVVGWRWDAGDGRPFVTTAGPSLTVTYGQPGLRTVRAEALTENGHTWVAARPVRVDSGGLFLPWSVKARR